MAPDLYTCPADQITFDLLREFVTGAIAAAAQPESLVLEFKEKRSGNNIAEAVAAMANTSGGLVLVGVAEAAADPIVGLTSGDVDGVVNHLRAVMPDALPEVVNVSLEDDPKRSILVLRVDADAVDPPIVLNGRVLVRIPGASVGARRDEVLRLAAPRTAAASGVYGIPIDVASLQLWEKPANVEVRLHAQFTLPRNRPTTWLGTAARHAIEGVLQESPLPTKVFAEFDRRGEVLNAYWSPTQVSSLNVRYRSSAVPSAYRGRPSVESLALVAINGRHLDIVVSTIATARIDDTFLFSSVDLRDLLLGSAATAVSAGHAVARNLRADAPLRPPLLTAWAGGDPGLAGLRIDVDFGSSSRYVEAERPATRNERRFDALSPRGSSIDDLEDAVRIWLMPLILDHGGVDFEEKLEALPLPRWVQPG